MSAITDEMLKEDCRVCGRQKWAIAYRGLVRDGTFGRSVEGLVWRCDVCATEYLPARTDLHSFYEGESYRKTVGEQTDAESFFSLHDAEQFRRFPFLENITLRKQSIADIGCAAGSFLDFVKGVAGNTIAVEPAVSYHKSLLERGHSCFGSTEAAVSEWGGKVDLVCSFSVIEHVHDPVNFLRGMKDLAKPGGTIVISTPNLRDVLMQLPCEAYRAFFYRTVHTYYFDSQSLARVGEAAGLGAMRVRYLHRFGFANFTGWLQQNRPTGGKGATCLGRGFDGLWKAQLEANGTADYLYAYWTV